MHIEIVRRDTSTSACGTQGEPEMRLAGGEPGRVRPQPGTRVGFAADTVRPVGPAGGAVPEAGGGHAMLVQIDGQTVVEMAGFHDAPGVVLEGGG